MCSCRQYFTARVCIGRELLQVGEGQASAQSGMSGDGVSSTDAMDVDSDSGRGRERSMQNAASDGQPAVSCFAWNFYANSLHVLPCLCRRLPPTNQRKPASPRLRRSPTPSQALSSDAIPDAGPSFSDVSTSQPRRPSSSPPRKMARWLGRSAGAAGSQR